VYKLRRIEVQKDYVGNVKTRFIKVYSGPHWIRLGIQGLLWMHSKVHRGTQWPLVDRVKNARTMDMS
jgi:hypothetical protein